MSLAAMLAASSDGRIVGLAVVGAGAGVYWFYQGFRLLQRKRLILNTPASKIQSAAMGLVEISGLAVGPYVITSPMKRASCYYYRSIAWQLKQQGKNSEWVKVAEESLHVPFYLDDNSDRVLVDPRGAEMDLHCDLREKYSHSFVFENSTMPGSVAEFLARHGVNPDRQIKVEEYCIKPKNFLFVLGTLSQNPGLDASVMPAWAERARIAAVENSAAPPADAPAAEVIRLSHPQSEIPVAQMTQQQRIAAALLKAGVSNPAAWTTAGIAGVGVQPALAKLDPTPRVTEIHAVTNDEPSGPVEGTFDLHPPVVLMKGSHEPAFFVSWRSQRDVVKSLGWKSSLMIWGGPALTLACVYFLLARFNLL